MSNEAILLLMNSFTAAVASVLTFIFLRNQLRKAVKDEARQVVNSSILTRATSGWSPGDEFAKTIKSVQSGRLGEEELSFAFADYLLDSDLRESLRDLRKNSLGPATLPYESLETIHHWSDKIHQAEYFKRNFVPARADAGAVASWIFLKLAWQLATCRYIANSSRDFVSDLERAATRSTETVPIRSLAGTRR